jgi:hypothetical protein
LLMYLYKPVAIASINFSLSKDKARGCKSFEYILLMLRSSTEGGGERPVRLTANSCGWARREPDWLAVANPSISV